MNPLLIGGLTAGIGALGNIIGGNSQNASNERLTREQLAEQKRQFDAQQRQRGAETGLEATQMDPLTQQRSRQQMALVEQLMRNYQPASYDMEKGDFSGGFSGLNIPELFKNISQFWSPDALRDAEGSFASNAGAASGGQYRPPNLDAAGYAPPSGNRTVTPMPTVPVGTPAPTGTPGTAVPRNQGAFNFRNPFADPEYLRGSRKPNGGY